MTLPSSGPISISDLYSEFGGSGGSTWRMSEYYKGGSYVPSNVSEGSGRTIPTSGRIDLSDFYGASATPAAQPFTLNVTSNAQNYRVYNEAIAAGWDGQGALTVNVYPGVYLWTDSSYQAALSMTNTYPNGVRLNNYGYIMGRGGDNNELTRYSSIPGYTVQSANGGGAILVADHNVIIDNKSSGYILGGGGAGSPANTTSANPAWAGGGGAGGGTGSYYASTGYLSRGGAINQLGDAGPYDINTYTGYSIGPTQAGGGGAGGIYWVNANNSNHYVINGGQGGGRKIPPNDTGGTSRTARVGSTDFQGGIGGTAGNNGNFPVVNSNYVPAAGGGGGGYGGRGGSGWDGSSFNYQYGVAGVAVTGSSWNYTVTGTTSQIYGNY